MAQLAQRRVQWPRVLDLLDHDADSVGDGGQTTHTDVGTDA